MTTIAAGNISVDRWFWLKWAALTLASWMGGGLLMLAIAWQLVDPIARALGSPPPHDSFSAGLLVATTLAFGVGALVAGLIVGAAQRLLLGKHLAGAGRWMTATLLGYPLGIGIGIALALLVTQALRGNIDGEMPPIALLIGMAVAGATIGAAQWLVLRHERQGALLWIIASMFAFALFFWLNTLLAGTAGETLVLWGSGLLFSALTGLTMAWLLRQPAPDSA